MFVDVSFEHEHILNISSYELSFFQKLILCRGLKFAIPQRVSPVEIKASFEKAYWNLERHLPNENLRELAAATLRSVGKVRDLKMEHEARV